MLPSVFISHGSPMHALQPGPAGEAWAALGRKLPGPRALVIASAHWETNIPMLTGNARPETIHDFSGFPEPLYRLRYQPPGAPALADRAAALLQGAGLAPAGAPARGLDHGAWVPLRSIYPKADVPVTQLAIQPRRDARWHFRVGEALALLRRENILILASGGAVHNLSDLSREGGATPAWARAFDDWLAEKLAAGDTEAVLDWEKAPEARRAHPSEDHFLPIFVAMGAAGRGTRAERIHRGFELGSLSLAAFQFGS